MGSYGILPSEPVNPKPSNYGVVTCCFVKTTDIIYMHIYTLENHQPCVAVSLVVLAFLIEIILPGSYWWSYITVVRTSSCTACLACNKPASG